MQAGHSRRQWLRKAGAGALGAACWPLLAQADTAAAGGGAGLMITSGSFGELPDGKPVKQYALGNANGMRVRIIDYGGIVASLLAPDRDGGLADVVLGFDSLQGYLAGHPYFGCIVGRYANRIARGHYELDGESYTLAVNNEPNHLHGGIKGFDKFVWNSQTVRDDDAVGVKLTLRSPDGDEGYPGEVHAEVTYWLTNANELRVDFEAVTDAPTHVNLTHHGYFNLDGHDAGDATHHVLTLHADRYTPVDETLIPTGELAPVAGTPLDFTEPTPIGERIDSDHEQIQRGAGYDHNFVINRDGPGLVPAAEVYSPASGRVMEVLTTQPGVQLYTGNFLDGSDVGKGGHAY
jgi:aldose 1-epimerase